MLLGGYDTVAWRLLERTENVRSRAWRRLRMRARPPSPVPEPMFDPPRPGDWRWITAAVPVALAHGAADLAARWTATLSANLMELPDDARIRYAPSHVEVAITVGESEVAKERALALSSELAQSDAGQSLFTLLCQRDAGLSHALRLPSGRLNTLAVSRLIDSGRMHLHDLDAELMNAEVLRNPDLHLLRYRCGDKASVRRFLRAHRLTAGDASAATPNILETFRFQAPGPSADNTLVSVIISAHNAESSIEYSVNSILEQSHGTLEVLVCDDASSDATLEILRTRFANDPRVAVFQSEINQGPYNIRNQLVERAGGRFVTFHDADDRAHPQRVERQLNAMKSGAAACYGNWVRIRPDGRFVFFKDQASLRMSVVSLMLERQLFLSMGGFRNARFAADFEFYDKLRWRFGDAAIARVRAPLIFGLWGTGSITQQDGGEALENGFRAPKRRLYSELVFRSHVRGELGVDDAGIERTLNEHHVLIAPQPITRVAR